MGILGGYLGAQAGSTHINYRHSLITYSLPWLSQERGRLDTQYLQERGKTHHKVPFLTVFLLFSVDSAETSLLNKLIRTSLVESSHHVEILQQDPKSPLFSVKTFEELPL